jgi:hypothetical protein
MKKFIIESKERDSILGMHINATKNHYIMEQKSDKIFFAFDDDITDYQGYIGRDGYLYPYTEMEDTWKVGPISKVPYVGSTFVRIDKRDGKEDVYVSKKNSEDVAKLELVPNYKVTEVNFSDIPR